MAARDLTAELKFRDPVKARALADALQRNLDAIGREVKVMHVCGSHEQAIARFGLRAVLPPHLKLIMGPGCPVCVTDGPEVDEAVATAVVSKPEAMKTTSSAGWARATSTAWATE